MKKQYDVLVLGGGSAGMAAAIEASKLGASVALIEMEDSLGGILKQCIHNGFGLHYFKEELTGPEYAARFEDIIHAMDIDIYLSTMITGVNADKTVEAASPNGLYVFNAKAVVIALGSRERTAGGIWQPGTRPAGIYTAGFAQKLVNIDGFMVGKRIVILGSGDIGLIMARRMTFEGAKVVAVLELMPYSSGLNRNIVQCVNDFDIPLKFSYTVTRTVGIERLEGVFVSPVDDKLTPLEGKEEFIQCDCLLLSVGLIPSVDIFDGLRMLKSQITGSFLVDDRRETSIPGFFAAGNVLHIHDLVDNVTNEGQIAGMAAAEHARLGCATLVKHRVEVADGIRYALPQLVRADSKSVKIYFRVANVIKNATVTVVCNGGAIFSRRFKILSPGEMESVTVDGEKIDGDITLEVKYGEDA